MRRNPDMVAHRARLAWAPHVAALGLSFATDGGFGGGFSQKSAFVGLKTHSWNRQDSVRLQRWSLWVVPAAIWSASRLRHRLPDRGRSSAKFNRSV
jgi:glucose/arabinose dehydrogenase